MKKIYRVFYIRKFEYFKDKPFNFLRKNKKFDIYIGCWAIFSSKYLLANSVDEAIQIFKNRYEIEYFENIPNDRIGDYGLYGLYIYNKDEEIEYELNRVRLFGKNMHNIKSMFQAIEYDVEANHMSIDEIKKYLSANDYKEWWNQTEGISVSDYVKSVAPRKQMVDFRDEINKLTGGMID